MKFRFSPYGLNKAWSPRKRDVSFSTYPSANRRGRVKELEKVLERGYQIDIPLSSYCIHYPLFVFRKWVDKETGEERCGQVLMCKDCRRGEPNPRCKYRWEPI